MTQEKDRIFLQNAIGVLGLAITEDQVAGLMSFTDLLIKWNKIYNLTAITAPSEVLTKHILDQRSWMSVQGEDYLQSHVQYFYLKLTLIWWIL